MFHPFWFYSWFYAWVHFGFILVGVLGHLGEEADLVTEGADHVHLWRSWNLARSGHHRRHFWVIPWEFSLNQFWQTMYKMGCMIWGYDFIGSMWECDETNARLRKKHLAKKPKKRSRTLRKGGLTKVLLPLGCRGTTNSCSCFLAHILALGQWFAEKYVLYKIILYKWNYSWSMPVAATDMISHDCGIKIMVS